MCKVSDKILIVLSYAISANLLDKIQSLYDALFFRERERERREREREETTFLVLVVTLTI